MKNIDSKYRIYGRRKGRKKKNINLNKNIINKIILNEINLNQNNYNILDIGSGSGENSLYLSKLYPNSKIFACEIFLDGNLNLCNQIFLKKIKNITIYNGNVIELLDNINKKNFFDLVSILFPDPWPKKRPNSRRLLNIKFINQLLKFIKKNGEIHIATDSKPYLRQILTIVYKLKNYLLWKNQSKTGWEYDINILPKTKYLKKALKSDRKPFYIKLIKI